MENQISKVAEKVLQIINSIKKDTISFDMIETDFEKIGISSIEFIKIIVECELFWEIEFEEDKLDIANFKNLYNLAQYIILRISAA